jgi:hypothetical protein
VTVTRRGALIGAGSLAAATRVAHAAALPTENYVLRFTDDSRRETIELVDLTELPEGVGSVRLRWNRRDFGPEAFFQIGYERVAYPPPQNSAEARRPPSAEAVLLPLAWTLTIHRASFPGEVNKRFEIRAVFRRSDILAPSRSTSSRGGSARG